MITNTKRMLIASLTTAVLASSTLASAHTVRSLMTSVGTRPVETRPVGSRVIPVRPYANSTTRTTFVAGGATLPALAYEGSSAITNDPSTPTTGSIFSYFKTLTGVTTQYCQTGSGFGKKVFDGAAGLTGGVNGACPAIGVSAGTTSGFGAPAALALTDPDITGSDAPLAQSEYTLFVNNKDATRGEAVELPSIVGSIALFYNNPDLGTTKLALTDSQICSLVEGKITNWSQLGKKSRALFFAYRSDGSGTTFAFSNHLVKVCGSSSGLSVSQQFAPTATSSAPYVIPEATPANFAGFSGNQGVVNGIKGTTGTIGYVEAANAEAAVVSGTDNFATVNGKDPVKDLPQTAAALKYSSSTISLDSAVVTTGGPATVAPLSGVKKAGCVVLVDPSAYADITQGYSIVAVTNFLFSANGNGATNASHLRSLVTELNTPTNFAAGKITTVNAPSTTSGTGTTGYAALGSTFNAPLESVANSCIGT
jgi:ABC-type phosphate transport system substrate-binding protein